MNILDYLSDFRILFQRGRVICLTLTQAILSFQKKIIILWTSLFSRVKYGIPEIQKFQCRYPRAYARGPLPFFDRQLVR